MKRTSRDLTEGSVTMAVLSFAIPIFLAQLFQNLYNSVDSIFVGQFVGKTALAAVSTCGEIAGLLTGFFVGLSAGAGILFSRCFGGKRYDDLHDAIHTAISFSVLIGVGMSALGILLTEPLLTMIACPADVWDEAVIYLRIYLVGILFTSIYNVCSGALRAVGDSRTPLYFLIISSLVNVALDYIFIAVMQLGVAGAALATVGSQLLSVTMVTAKMLRTEDVFRLVPADLRIKKPMLMEILRLGLPAAIQSCLSLFSNLFVQRYINGFGSAAMAGMGAGKKIERFAGLVGHSIGMSATTIVSQNVGARKYGRAYSCVRKCLLISLIVTIAISIPTYIFARPLSQIFSNDAATVDIAVSMIRTMLPFFYFQAVQNIFANTVRSFGRSTATMVLSILGMIGCRQLFLAVGMGISYSITVVYLCFPVGWICSALFVFIDYIVSIRRKYKGDHSLKEA